MKKIIKTTKCLFWYIFDNDLCAFRKDKAVRQFLRLFEVWKAAFDTNEYVAAVLMDLSKAFDCIPMKQFYF